MSTTTAPAKAELRRARPLDVIFVLLPVIALVVFGWGRRWVADDAFINFRIVENFLNGDGIVFNAGERVEAGTSTLWLMILALFEWLPTPLEMEWWSVLLGIALTVVGLVFGSLGALNLTYREGRPQVAFPVGVIVLAALPPMWDYVTSGLENGLSYAWLGGSFYLLVFAVQARTVRRSVLTGVVISLGILVRPDLGIFWACFGVVLLACMWSFKWRPLLITAVALFAIPSLFELYRLGYFAAPAPNTALAKEASLFRPDQGLVYVFDLVRPYLLFIPAFLVLVLLLLSIPKKSRLHQAVWAAPLVGGLFHVGYVVLVGGDYMHGRMLLPSVFALLLPVMALWTTKRQAVPALMVLAWAVPCCLFLRIDYGNRTEPSFIDDERIFYIQRAAINNPDPPAHPVTLADYGHVPFTKLGLSDRNTALRESHTYRDLVLDQSYENERPLAPSVKAPLAVTTGNIGMYGYAVGTEVLVLDTAGLADPLASRVTITQRGKPGHEKRLPPVWFQARYAPSETPSVQETAAIEALRCGDLARIVEATSAPLDASLFVENLLNAPHYWKVRLPADPVAARDKFCR